MTGSALLLSVIGLLLGLLPLWPSGSAVAVLLAALGFLPALSGLFLALANRSQALRLGLRLGWATGTLVLSVAATLLCTVWLLALVVVWRTPQGRTPRGPLPSPQTVERLPSTRTPVPQRACATMPVLPRFADFEYTGPTSSLG